MSDVYNFPSKEKPNQDCGEQEPCRHRAEVARLEEEVLNLRDVIASMAIERHALMEATPAGIQAEGFG